METVQEQEQEEGNEDHRHVYIVFLYSTFIFYVITYM